MNVLALVASLACLQTPNPKDVRSVEVRAKFFVIAYEAEEAGQVMFPLPLDHRGQVPVGFQLKVKPESIVDSTKIRTTDTGDNVLELKLRPMKRDQRIEVEWKSQLVVDMGEPYRIPDQPIPTEVPAKVAQWLRPSAYVQSDHPAIIAKAKEVKASTFRETIAATLMLCVKIKSGQKGMAEELSSVTALTMKGSCTSEANLLAALLRANGIPARLLSGYPTYAGRPYDTHYIVEAYCGDAGWITASPGDMSCMVPVVSISSVTSENEGGRRISAAAGVPYLSLTETSGKLVARGLLSSTYSEHEAKLDLRKPIDSAVWGVSKERWAKWIESSRSQVVNLPASYLP